MAKRHLLFLSFIFIFSSCNSKPDLDLNLPSVRLVKEDSSWAMVDRGIIRAFKTYDVNADVLFHLRGGEIIEVINKTAFTQKVFSGEDHWYQIRAYDKEAWVFGKDIIVYDTQKLAENARQRYELGSN
jgi:hypothetical protein